MHFLFFAHYAHFVRFKKVHIFQKCVNCVKCDLFAANGCTVFAIGSCSAVNGCSDLEVGQISGWSAKLGAKGRKIITKGGRIPASIFSRMIVTMIMIMMILMIIMFTIMKMKITCASNKFPFIVQMI